MGESSVLEDHPTDEVSATVTPSKAEAGCLEVRGRAARNNRGGDRARRTLGKMAQGLEDRKEGSAMKRPIGKRRQERDSHSGKVKGIKRIFEAKGQPLAKPW